MNVGVALVWMGGHLPLQDVPFRLLSEGYHEAFEKRMCVYLQGVGDEGIFEGGAVST